MRRKSAHRAEARIVEEKAKKTRDAEKAGENESEISPVADKRGGTKKRSSCNARMVRRKSVRAAQSRKKVPGEIVERFKKREKLR